MTILSLIISFLSLSPVHEQPAQVEYCSLRGSVYIAEERGQADFLAYLEESEAFADFLVFEEENRLYATEEGVWFFVDNPSSLLLDLWSLSLFVYVLFLIRPKTAYPCFPFSFISSLFISRD